MIVQSVKLQQSLHDTQSVKRIQNIQSPTFKSNKYTVEKELLDRVWQKLIQSGGTIKMDKSNGYSGFPTTVTGKESSKKGWWIFKKPAVRTLEILTDINMSSNADKIKRIFDVSITRSGEYKVKRKYQHIVTYKNAFFYDTFFLGLIKVGKGKTKTWISDCKAKSAKNINQFLNTMDKFFHNEIKTI